MALFVALRVLSLSYLLGAITGQDIEVIFEGQGPDYKIDLAGVEWFRSGAVGIRHEGQLWSSENTEKYMLKVTSGSMEDGEDSIGGFVKQK